MVKIGQNNFKFTPAVNDDIAINVGEAQIPVSKRNELSAPPESPKSDPPAEQQMIFGEIPEIPTGKEGLYSHREKCYNTMTYRKEADAAWKPR